MLNRITIWLRLGFNEVVYWFVGDTPESHHSRAAYLWEELGKYKKSISHCQRYLAVTEDSNIRATMGYCYGALGDWNNAVKAYRTVPNPLREPAIALGLAEAELNVGNADEAQKIVVTVAVNNDNPSNKIAHAIEHITARLNEITNAKPDA